jgi:hypothetical protein
MAEAASGAGSAAMHRELAELLTTAPAAGLTPADFPARLESIHRRHLAGQADSPEFVKRRADALAAYDEITLGVDRHHQLEALAAALDVEE